MAEPAVPKKASLGVIFSVVFIDLLGFGILIPQLGVYAVEFKASAIEVGLIASIYSLMQLICAPFWGRLSDRVGRRPVLLTTIAGGIGAYLLFGFTHQLWMLALSRIVAGIAGANISTAQAYVSDVTSPENRAKAMGLIGAAFGIGFVLGPAVGGFLGKAGGNLYIGLFCAGLSAINFVSALVRLPESLDKSHPSHREKKAALSLPVRMRLPGIGILFALALLVTTAFAQVEGTFSMYLLVRFLSPDAHVELSLFDLSAKVPQKVLEGASLQVGWLFSVIGVVGAIIQGGLIGRLKQKLGEPNLIRIGLVCWGLGVATLPMMPSYGWMFAPTVVMAIGSALTNPALSSLVSLRAPGGRSGEILGTFQSFSAMGRILGPSLGGFWFATFSSGTPFYVGGALLLLAAMIAMMIGTASPPANPVVENP